MFKNLKLTLAAMTAVLTLSGCGSECNEEVLKEKMQEITVKVQDLAATGDLSKLMEFSQKAGRISQSMQGGGDNLQAACDAADDLLDEL
jgi:outer membrane murein-binding lipoprotein Lpp